MKTALLIEDHPTIRRGLQTILGRHGWWVDAMSSVEATLVHLHHTPPQVILLDWDIAQGSGLTLLRVIKLDPEWQSIPVVMMHSGATPEQLKEAFDLGAKDFLEKPFSWEAALKKLDRWAFSQDGIPTRRL